MPHKKKKETYDSKREDRHHFHLAFSEKKSPFLYQFWHKNHEDKNCKRHPVHSDTRLFFIALWREVHRFKIGPQFGADLRVFKSEMNRRAYKIEFITRIQPCSLQNMTIERQRTFQCDSECVRQPNFSGSSVFHFA